MKKIFVVDWLLVLSFVITAFSGFELHIAGHFSNHEIWHNRAVGHIFASCLFLLFGVMHIQNHWNWYKNGLGKKSRVTLSVTIIFVIATVTGLLLLGINGANSGMGIWHYRIGIILTIIGMGHFIKRFQILKKSLSSK